MAEIFSITEIFSTFYEKVTHKREDKAALLARLSEFKENIYKNSNNLEECYKFFKPLPESTKAPASGRVLKTGIPLWKPDFTDESDVSGSKSRGSGAKRAPQAP